MTSVTPHHVQAQEWAVILHVCIICENTLYSHIYQKKANEKI